MPITLKSHALDEAAHLCRWRPLGLFVDAQKVVDTIELLEKFDIRPSAILVIAKHPTGQIPPVNWIPVTWASQGFGLGSSLGLLVAVIVSHWLGSSVLVEILGSCGLIALGGLSGWHLGANQPRALIKPFWRDVEQGSYLMLIHTTQSTHQRVLPPVRRVVGNLYETQALVA